MSTDNNISPGETGNNLFPVFLKLENMRLLIVGGGYVGLEKLTAVLQNSPRTKITLVATQISDEIKETVKKYESITLIETPFNESHVDGHDVVIVGINDKATSRQIHGVVKQKGKLVNVADTPDLCDFYLSSVVKKGNLKIAISTNGKSPTVAKRVKEVLNSTIPDEIDELLDNVQAIRNTLTGDFDEKVKELNELTKSLIAKKI